MYYGWHWILTLNLITSNFTRKNAPKNLLDSLPPSIGINTDPGSSVNKKRIF